MERDDASTRAGRASGLWTEERRGGRGRAQPRGRASRRKAGVYGLQFHCTGHSPASPQVTGLAQSRCSSELERPLFFCDAVGANRSPQFSTRAVDKYSSCGETFAYRVPPQRFLPLQNSRRPTLPNSHQRSADLRNNKPVISPQLWNPLWRTSRSLPSTTVERHGCVSSPPVDNSVERHGRGRPPVGSRPRHRASDRGRSGTLRSRSPPEQISASAGTPCRG